MPTPLPKFPWKKMVDWYRENGRHTLPWRDYTHDGKGLSYRVWLSEIFLQQTQVSRVIGYFERVRERFPTVESLADTDYETFFPYYQGLGYYSRARNMLKTAKIVNDEYGGIFPRELEKLKILPGVGEYTARAILAFGYSEPYLAWDTNLEKVFARYYHGSRLDTLSNKEKNEIEEDFRQFVDSAERTAHTVVRDVNNALMDFASLVDLKNPANIDWESYPIRSGKFYDTRGRDEPTEVKKSMSFPIPDATVVVVLHRDHKVYYAPVISSADDSRSREILLDKKQDIFLIDMTARMLEGYLPFILPPGLTRDTRAYVQSYFRECYGLELSVRPIHKKWLSEDGKPYVLVHAQVQVGKHDFREYTKGETMHVLSSL